MKGNSVFFENLFKNTVATAVQIVRRHHLIPGIQQLDYRIDSGQSTTERQTVPTVLYTCQRIFKCRARRVGTSGVFIPLMPARRGLRIGRGLVCLLYTSPSPRDG